MKMITDKKVENPKITVRSRYEEKSEFHKIVHYWFNINGVPSGKEIMCMNGVSTIWKNGRDITASVHGGLEGLRQWLKNHTYQRTEADGSQGYIWK